jgi:hypothetical protein
MKKNEIAKSIMLDFARRTGLTDPMQAPVRYLWTDAFAVCNFWALYQQEGDAYYRQLALRLVDQVHQVLGKHREDDLREGWISGLSEEEGSRHPTLAGLRIGKKLPERPPNAPYDPQSEWDREGQYYHYLTKWMLALYRTWQMTGEDIYLRWAAELAKTAYERFSYTTPYGVRRMYWKMSIDLSYPLVTSMGQHDALDGYIIYRLIGNGLQSAGMEELNLLKETEGLWQMLSGMHMATEDALGAGGLLSDVALLLEGLEVSEDRSRELGLLEDLLQQSIESINKVLESEMWRYPATYRLGFRELGLSIGLKGIDLRKNALASLPKIATVARDEIFHFIPLAEQIQSFWLEASNRQKTWREHLDINEVML